jgi:hypothetical protein
MYWYRMPVSRRSTKNASPGDEFVWLEYAKGEDEGADSTVAANHCTPEEAGEIAQNAGVETLISSFS